jgi:KAP family P-loop domain
MSGAKELIDDRALESVDGDRLRHDDLATELAEVLATVRAPASVALWGPWGSGKSGLANLLKAKLAQRKKKARFVRFDAFKFAETPLRRHFISQVAEALKINDDEFRDGLYRTTSHTNLKIPKKHFLKLLFTFLWVLVVVEACAVALILVLAALSPGSFSNAWHDLARSGLALALAPAGILAAFTALAGRTLPVDRTRSAPSSDEEFERLFKKLVVKANADPLVIFIDELDRCSSEEVVSTLEAIRTFLDVEGAVYVVAADQQVLERALRESARQSTPPDAINPYYSAGSAYLDKIFQYQFSVPPVRTRGLWDFAEELTDDLDGVWKEIDRQQVISVLIPTHVRSPRRVKRLLNGFVLTYRLAKRRAEEEVVDGPVSDRAAEIAKLVCLQIEFPLFAADLSIEPRLPDHVLSVKRGENLPSYLPPEVRRRAQGYAEGRLNVDEVIAIDEDRGGREEVGDDDNQDSPKSEAGLAEREAEKKGSEVARVSRIHAEQLIRYLQKTRHIKGPSGDLVFMESRGSLFGLDAAVADSLSDAAIDGDSAEVKRMVGELGDSDLQRAALRLLAQRGTEASIGIGGQNAIGSLLAAISGLPDLDLDGVADEVADAVATHEESGYELESDQLGGALALAVVSTRQVSGRLLKLVLARNEAIDSDLGVQVVREAEAIPMALSPRVTEIAIHRLPMEPSKTVAAMISLDDKTLQPLLEKVASDLPAHLEALAAAKAEAAQAEAEAEGQ